MQGKVLGSEEMNVENPSISEAGQIQSPRAASVLARLLLPLLTVFGHGTYAYFRFIA